jgi:hypothetical protein
MSDKTESMFALRYAVSVEVAASPATLWARLTNSAGFPSWNSTVEKIEGDIALGTKLAIRVPIAPGRVFTPTVVELVPAQRMVWRDGFAPMFQGTRTFTLTPNAAGGTTFSMVEEFRGLMLPLIKRSLPDFRPVFDRYAADLRRACAAP